MRMTVACVAVCLVAEVAQSASTFQRHAIAIPRESLDLALRDLAAQTGLQIARFSDNVDSELVVGPVNGSLTPQQALDELLRGQKLKYLVINERIIAIVGWNESKPAGSSTPSHSVQPPTVLPERAVEVATAATPPMPTVEQSGVTEVMVTGSRIIRDGYDTPTPVTIVDVEIFGRSANAALADVLYTTAAFSGGQNIRAGADVPSSNQAGIAGVALRSLGGIRTLVLLDGQRSVPAVSTGVVDTNNFPQQLIARVETVTGGASAVYGSDAVAGVVNFVLDRKFTGFKAELSAGATTYGDGENWKVALARGMPFADGRGHLLLSGELVDDSGIVNGNGSRGWARTARNYYVNPSYDGVSGEPEFLLADNVFLSQATHGGIITSGPLRGIAFGEGGVPYQFNYGAGVPRDNFMSGGDYRSTLTDDAYSLAPSQKRENIFMRVAYDVSDNLNAFVQVSRGVSETYGIAFPHYQVGAGPLILSGNPFIPASVQQRMTELGLESIRIGTMNYDMPFVAVDTMRAANRFVLGAEGRLNAFNTQWTWNAYAQLGETSSSYDTRNVENIPKYALALDAVRDPVTGAIMCRSTLTDPSNGCVPWNPMGTGVNGPEAKKYLLGTAHADQTTRQIVYAAAITGKPFSNWAGPVSLALSGEFRQEKATVDSDPEAQQGAWRSGNLQPLDAGFHVAEAAVETLVPLAAKLPLIHNWDLSGAFRATDYEISGSAETWKIGMTYAPVPDVRFRGTISRDIRAPSINELFQNLNIGLTATYDPVTNTTPTHGRTQRGNLSLTPEKADSMTVGVVLQPAYLPGLSLSADYWDIDVKDAVTLITGSNTINLCYGGRPDLCSKITRVNGVITTVEQGNYNLARQKASGIDVDATYHLPLATLFADARGELEFRFTGTRYIENVTDDGIAPPDNSVGIVAGVPGRVLTATVAYEIDDLEAALSVRSFSGVVADNDFIQCRSNCPESTVHRRTFDRLGSDGATYFDASISYRLSGLLGGRGDARLFFNVRNLFNEDPELTPQIGTSGLGYVYSRSQNGRWDKLGRVLRAGLTYQF
ncbi:TonB-dependent receptor [Steroidobacter cummioxidans]|uniref:TonB-dependent receptor n=1 Tax=Steroidobacter cummioxidans TaxID=1803913 RepID=UPI000E3242D2|nr:TonB-dependent receptor [Steroidobacter cummioxidans]